MCNSSERQGIHKVGMYECEWQDVNIYYSRAHEIFSLWLQEKSFEVFEILVIVWCVGRHSAVGLNQLHSAACVLNRFENQEGRDLLQRCHLQITTISLIWVKLRTRILITWLCPAELVNHKVIRPFVKVHTGLPLGHKGTSLATSHKTRQSATPDKPPRG